jgi:hypothetical protein
MRAAMGGHADAVSALIAAGASVTAVDVDDGWTALMHAVVKGHVDAAKRLHAAGASITAPDQVCLPAAGIMYRDGRRHEMDWDGWRDVEGGWWVS